MLTREATGGGDYLFVSADGSAVWLTATQAKATGPLRCKCEPVACPYTGNTCTRACAAVTSMIDTKFGVEEIVCWAIGRGSRGRQPFVLAARPHTPAVRP